MTLKRSPLRRVAPAPAREPAVVMATCAVCPRLFRQVNSLHRACSPGCAFKLVRADKREAAVALRADRKATRARLEAIKPRSKWLAEAQAAFNAWVRRRDQYLPCISCQRFHQGAWDAGHYLTVGARPELRFDEDNVHRQCVPCNRHLHGNLIRYRVGLIERRGLAVVERLEGPHPTSKLTVDDLREIRDRYRALARLLPLAA